LPAHAPISAPSSSTAANTVVAGPAVSPRMRTDLVNGHRAA
jgi:hypothetical protein